MVKAVRIHEFGGPDVMKFEDVDAGDPGPGQVRLTTTAAGVHFADVMVRSGTYFLKPELPATLGLEGAGVIDAVGADVDWLKVGQNVAYVGVLGSYTEARVMDAGRLVPLPDGIGPKTAAASLLRGLTVQYLLRQTTHVGEGDRVLVHAAAGGVGTILCQWAKHLGAMVIGTAGSDEKTALASANGCDHVINYSTENFAEQIADITGGAGVTVVFDSIGQSAYENNVSCLAAKGTFVNYGHSSGLLPPIDAMLLNQKSLVFTKTSLKDYVADKATATAMGKEFFGHILSGVIKINISREYALADAAQAHTDLAGRKTTGSIILVA